MNKGDPTGNGVEDCVDAGVPERHVLNALCRPVSLQLARWNAPDLLVVGLEEVIKETLAESIGDPVLQALFWAVPSEQLGNADLRPRPKVGNNAAHRFDNAEVLQRIGGLERVIEVFPVVEDAAHSRTHEKFLVGQNFVPKVLDWLNLGEEAMTTEVEAPAISFDGSGDAADGVGRFKDGARSACLREFECSGETGGSGTDDDHRRSGAGGRVGGSRHQVTFAMRNGVSVVKGPLGSVDLGADSDGGAAVLCGPMQPNETAPAGSSAADRARPEIIALAVVAVAVGVISRFVTRSSLWLDEALSVDIARLPLGQLSEALKHDGHPPLYYVLLHGWMNLFGTSDVAVRSLSGLFGLLTLPVVWVIGRRKGGPTLGWIAVAVVAVSPFAVRYSNETRMYSLVILLVSVGWLLVDDVVDRGKATIGRFVAIALVGALLLYTHYWSLWLLGALGITALWKVWRAKNRDERRPWIGLILALVVAGIAFVPWLPTMLYQSAHTGTPWAKASRPTSALSLTLADNGGGNYGEQTLVGAFFAIALVLGIFGYAIDRRTSGLDLRTRPALRGAAWIAALTFAIGCIVSFASSSAFASRYSAVIFPFLALLAAAGCCCFASRRVRFGVAAVFCAFLAIGAAWNIIYERTQVKAIANLVASSSSPGDIVVFCPDQLGPAGARVMPSGLTLLSYPTYGDPNTVDWVDYAERNSGSDPDAFAARLLADAGVTHSIYVVWSDSYKTFEGKCSGLISALSVARTPQQVLGEDGDKYYEHASLTRFAPRS